MSEGDKMSFYKTGTPYTGFVKLEHWRRPTDSYDTIVVRASDSVVGLLYDATNDRVLLIRQARAAMIREDNPEGMITECVAGRFDVNLGPKALMVKEALEEASVVITEKDVTVLNQGKPMALSAGVLTERSYVVFAEVHPDQVTGSDDDTFGLASEGESIQRVWVSTSEFLTMVVDEIRVFALQQFLGTIVLLEDSKESKDG